MEEPITHEVTAPEGARHWSHHILRPSKRDVLIIAVTVSLAVFFAMVAVRTYPRGIYDAFLAFSLCFFLITLIRQIVRRRKPATNLEVQPEGAPNSRIALLPALIAGFLAYAWALFFYFICDDFDILILGRQGFFKALWPYLTFGQPDEQGRPLFFRPLGYASLFLDYQLWHGWAPGYHLVNLLFHLLCIAGVFFLCRGIGLKAEISGIAALFFAILPVNVETVAWIICRFDLIASACVLWSLIFCLRFRRTGQINAYVVAMALFVCGAITKEVAYILPLLWLPLELAIWKRVQIKPFLGFLGVAALTFLHRYYLLGGIAGYRLPNGAPQVNLITISAIVGLLVRAPAETLFGYNWLQPTGILPVAGALTAAIVVTWSLIAQRTSATVRLVWFTLFWILAGALPAHFYFWREDLGLSTSRVLYCGSAGLAILIALLLEGTFRQPIFRRGWAAVLSGLLIVGLLHNLNTWNATSNASRRFTSDLKRLEPAPPPQTTFYIEHLPIYLRGVPFFVVGLSNAAQFVYNRSDVSAIPEVTNASCFISDNPTVIRLMWTGALERSPMVPFHAVNYSGAEKGAHELIWNGNGWENRDLPTIRDTSHPTDYVNIFDDGYITYFEATGEHVHALYSSPRGFSDADLTAATAAPQAAVGSPLTAAHDQNGAFVDYLGANGHVYEIWFMNTQRWHYQDLTLGVVPAAEAAPRSPLISFTNFVDGGHDIYYIGKDQHIYRIHWDPRNLHRSDLSRQAGAPVAAEGSSMASISLGSGAFIYYKGVNQHVYELRLKGDGTWTSEDLSDGVQESLLPDPESSLAAYGDDGGRDVIYLAKDGHIHELYQDTHGLQHHDLTLLSKAPLAVSKSRLSILREGNDTFVYYSGNDHHVYFLHSAKDAGWSARQVTLINGTNAPLVAEGSSIGITRGYCTMN